MSHKQENADII